MGAAKVEISFDSIKDRMFIPAIKVRDIVRARPLSASEKESIQRGSPDILINPVIGESYLIHRNDVIRNFVYTNGKRIKTSGWKAESQYVIFRADNTTVMVMQVPQNHTVVVNGVIANEKTRKSGDYIVCPLTENNEIDREHASVVSSAIFRKMCYIPRNEVIDRHRGSKNKFFDFISGVNLQDKFRDRKNRVINPIKQTPIPSGIRSTASVPKPNAYENSARYNIPKADSSYKVVGQIVDAYGKRVGFVISAPSGATKEIDKLTAMKLAENKKISNMEAVKSQSGDIYLRGNGIRLEDLPVSYR